MYSRVSFYFAAVIAPFVCVAGFLFAVSAFPQSAPPAPVAAVGRYIVVYRNGQIPANAEIGIARHGAILSARHELLGAAVLDRVSDATLAALANDPAVEAVVPDLLLSAHSLVTRVIPATALPFATPDALYHSPQGWAVQAVGGFGADGTTTAPVGPWNVTRGKGVRLAILDSGVDPAHPDIAPNLTLNLSEIVRTALPTPCDDGSPVDQQGHGTWTASLAAGALGPSTGLVAGVAPAASILNIKVLQRMPGVPSATDPTGCLGGQASGLLSWILQGIEDAITQRADILSMSFGTLVDITTGSGAGTQTVFNRATAAANQAGILLIAAAGNDGLNLSGSRFVELPAQSRDVLAVVASTNPVCAENLKSGAICKPGPVTLPYYSNFGSVLAAVAAPGGSYPSGGAADPATTSTTQSGWITGACASGEAGTLSGIPSDPTHSLGCFAAGHTAYIQAMGTSASAPLVAGAAALLLAQHPTWSPAAVIASIKSSASRPQSLAQLPLVNVAGAVLSAK